MYARQPPNHGFPRPARIPQNYSGNAFPPKEESPYPEPQDEIPPDTSHDIEPADQPAALPTALGKLFGRSSSGIGSEELLLLGLILLISQNHSGDDLLLLLVLLLLIG